RGDCAGAPHRRIGGTGACDVAVRAGAARPEARPGVPVPGRRQRGGDGGGAGPLRRGGRMSTVVVADQVRIPSWVNDLESFRRWSQSDDYPERGWVSFLDGEIWVDTHMEQLFSHNQVKTCFTGTLWRLAQAEERGYYFSDRALLIHEGANLSTEPDGTFCAYEAVEEGRVRLVEGIEEGYVELEGTPDMVLEIVSTYSVRKDTEVLRKLYWRAGISEYWLVDARKSPLQFDILRRTARGYAAARRQRGWLTSRVFERSFLLDTEPDRLGHPRYTLRMD